MDGGETPAAEWVTATATTESADGRKVFPGRPPVGGALAVRPRARGDGYEPADKREAGEVAAPRAPFEVRFDPAVLVRRRG
ncbi:hypothetical protein GCM10017673_03660 [Streptosporangium violaceochromogenes]|nr:hypothetical protein GCM10017673_03660 [Streptosporangium violaceochromogenes]